MLNQKQAATNYETFKHIEVVMQLLANMQHEIFKRMFSHDRSKLESPEMEMFAEFTDKLAGMTYGSDEYKQCLEEMKKTALGHHYENNRHHPEHFQNTNKNLNKIAECESLIKSLNYIKRDYLENESLDIEFTNQFLAEYKATLKSNVNEMNLIDILEMVCDWKAATLRHNDGDIYKSVNINTIRFGLSPQLVNIILNTIPLIEKNIYGGVNTQKNL